MVSRSSTNSTTTAEAFEMASAPPITPISRRSFSLPAPKPIDSSLDTQIEILYALPSARIVAFTTTSSSAQRPSSSNGSPMAVDEPGTLSWVSQLERTIAVGALKVYRAPGSVAFLSCSTALRPILPKSQAWCVDGDSKFVLQIRPPQYWRIEVPNQTTEEKSGVSELKKTLDQVLRFEKTPCPFRRDFTVELPAEPETPIKKKPWKPVMMLQPDRAPSPEITFSRRGSYSLFPERRASASPTRERSTSRAMMRSRSPSIVCEEPETTVPDARVQMEEDTQDNACIHPEDVVLPSIEEHEPIPAIPAVRVGPKKYKAGTSVTAKHRMKDELLLVTKDSLDSTTLESPETDYIFSGYDSDDNGSDTFSDATEDSNLTPKGRYRAPVQSLGPASGHQDTQNELQAPRTCSRSTTAPPVLSLVTAPPSRHRTKSKSPPRKSTIVESQPDVSAASSVESFHSVDSWHSPISPPPSPRRGPPTSAYPYPHDKIVLPKRRHHERDDSELTITPQTPQTWPLDSVLNAASSVRSASPLAPRTPLLSEGSEKSDEEPQEVATPPTVRQPRPTIRHRATTSSNSRRQALSPLPAAVNLFSPPKRSSRRLQTARHLPTAIIQKTCEILLSPPSHLFSLMLNIASKIAAGEWRGVLGFHGEAVHWDFEDEYSTESGGVFEDDYGIGLPHPGCHPSVIKANPAMPGGSWEVD